MTSCFLLSFLMDQKAAFDLVDHETLLAKMEEYWFDGSMLAWLKSYLACRCFDVQLGIAWSYPKQIGTQGVPQESVLGNPGQLYITLLGSPT